MNMRDRIRELERQVSETRDQGTEAEGRAARLGARWDELRSGIVDLTEGLESGVTDTLLLAACKLITHHLTELADHLEKKWPLVRKPSLVKSPHEPAKAK